MLSQKLMNVYEIYWGKIYFIYADENEFDTLLNKFNYK